MLIREEKNLGLSPSSSSQNKNSFDQQAFYSNRGRGKGQGTGGGVEAEAKIRMCNTIRVMDVEEDNKTLKAGGDMEIRILETGSRIQVLM